MGWRSPGAWEERQIVVSETAGRIGINISCLQRFMLLTPHLGETRPSSSSSSDASNGSHAAPECACSSAGAPPGPTGASAAATGPPVSRSTGSVARRSPPLLPTAPAPACAPLVTSTCPLRLWLPSLGSPTAPALPPLAPTPPAPGESMPAPFPAPPSLPTLSISSIRINSASASASKPRRERPRDPGPAPAAPPRRNAWPAPRPPPPLAAGSWSPGPRLISLWLLRALPPPSPLSGTADRCGGGEAGAGPDPPEPGLARPALGSPPSKRTGTALSSARRRTAPCRSRRPPWGDVPIAGARPVSDHPPARHHKAKVRVRYASAGHRHSPPSVAGIGAATAWVVLPAATQHDCRRPHTHPSSCRLRGASRASRHAGPCG